MNNNKIPKIIHQIWIGPRKKPDLWMDTWSKDYLSKYSDFKYMLWDNSNFREVLDKYPNILKIFYTEEFWVGKADILRMLILYEYGGIYIDADSVWINEKNLQELIDSTNDTGMFASKPPGMNILTNGVIGCTQYNKYMKFLTDQISKYTPRSYKRKRSINGVSKVVGPFFFDQLKSYNITVYPSSYFYPISWFGIKTNNLHETMDLPKESYMFQYGLSTNGLNY